jgi:antitoxin component YwqK of YwqJK toxin-antitoxin module
MIFCLTILIAGNIFAQNTINQTDDQGRKQGLWSKKDPSGRLIYQATFINDKPVGEMKRYHPNGKIKAIINFDEGTDNSFAQLFDEQGKLIAKGNYLGQKKNGEWTYLSENKIVSTETFSEGRKSGLSKRYYPTGELVEEAYWKNDLLDGLYRTFLPNGNPVFECKYSNGQRNGVFRTWYPNQIVELDGFYSADLRDKDWMYYDESGKVKYILKYNQGELLNPAVQDSIDQIQENSFKTKADHIPDPEKFMQNPDEYMRLMQNR